MCLDADVLLYLDASRRLIFCAKTHTRGRTCTHKHRRIKNCSAAFHVQAVISLGLESYEDRAPHFGLLSVDYQVLTRQRLSNP